MIQTPSPDALTTCKTDHLQHLLSLRAALNTNLTSDIHVGLEKLREQAAVRAQELALPTADEEEWRFTDLTPLRQVEFQPAPPQTTASELVSMLVLPEAPLRLVFVNGEFAPRLSTLVDLPAGLVLGNLQACREQPSLGQLPGAEDVFTTLNTASFTDAALIQVGSNADVAAPVHLLWLTTGKTIPFISHPRAVVVLAAGARLTLVEEFVSLGSVPTLTNGVTEIWLADNAELNHSRIQRQGSGSWEGGFHIGKTAVSQGRDSRYTINAISLGGQISRHNLDVYLNGEQTDTTLNGLTLATGDQLADTHSMLAFSRPHGTSNQVHKCIVSDRARAVFNGKVTVPKAAQLTNAAQLSRNLLLSPKARIDTKPQLEIVADNVKCAHGATVSQLDADEIFYLQSRGLDYQSASSLLVKGFVLETLQLLPIESLRQRLTDEILTRLHP